MHQCEKVCPRSQEVALADQQEPAQPAEAVLPRQFAMRAYAFSGGVLLGARSNSWPHVEKTWPGLFVALDGLSAAVAGSFTSLPQLFSVRNLPAFLQHGPPEEAVIGGWSIGANEMQEVMAVLAASARGVRAAFALDPRCSLPIQAQIFKTTAGLSLDRVISADFSRRITDRGGVLLTSSSGALRWRAPCRGLWFATPYFVDPKSGSNLAGFQPDDVNMERCEATMGTVTRLEASTSNHFLIGMDHAWDISRRLRRAAAPRGAARGDRDAAPR